MTYYNEKYAITACKKEFWPLLMHSILGVERALGLKLDPRVLTVRLQDNQAYNNF